MKIPYVEARDSESDNVVQGFYFEFPELTYCFIEDYEREPKVKLIPCVMSYRMTDWGLPNVPIICKPIDKSTLKIIGYIDTDNDYYIPKNYVIKKENEDIPIIHGKAELEFHDREIKEKVVDELVSTMKSEYYNKVGTQFDNAILEMEKIAARIKKGDT